MPKQRSTADAALATIATEAALARSILEAVKESGLLRPPKRRARRAFTRKARTNGNGVGGTGSAVKRRMVKKVRPARPISDEATDD